jgi:glycosyltransferase involved in cell wall biosynthesis
LSASTDICVAVLAHNEERRIQTCLNSLPLGEPDVIIHVVVNGSSDRTAELAREVAAQAGNVTVHDYPFGGKSRSWNRFVFDDLAVFSRTHVFVDGDAQLLPGSVRALAQALRDNPTANAASGMPMNGRKAAAYRSAMVRDHGLFGDLYAVQGEFLARMKARQIRLPDDLIGDDSLIGALAKTDLENETGWDDQRIFVCATAGFLCEPFAPFDVGGWSKQYRRMINYSVRHFQNVIISGIMRGQGPSGLPARMANLYPEHLAGFSPRLSPKAWWFDRVALARMAKAVSD